MKNGNIKKKTEKPGSGRRALVGCDLAMTWEMDGEKHSSHFNCQCIVTMESIEYAVKQIAATVAAIANKIAEGETSAQNVRASETATA